MTEYYMINQYDVVQELQRLAAEQYAEIKRLKELLAELQPDAERYRSNLETNRQKRSNVRNPHF
jgi:predicted lipase